MNKVYTDKEVRRLISDFLFLLDYVVMDQEEVQLFISQWLHDPKSKGMDDFVDCMVFCLK